MAEGSQLPLPFALKPPRSAAINNGRLNSSQAKTRARIREARRDGARKRKGLAPQAWSRETLSPLARATGVPVTARAAPNVPHFQLDDKDNCQFSSAGLVIEDVVVASAARSRPCLVSAHCTCGPQTNVGEVFVRVLVEGTLVSLGVR